MPDSARTCGAREPAPRLPLRTLLLVCAGCIPLLLVAANAMWGSEARRAAECRERIALLWSAARQEAEANGGSFPSGERALEELVFRRLRHERYSICPRTGRKYAWTRHRRHIGGD